jgi:hypothetical protein
VGRRRRPDLGHPAPLWGMGKIQDWHAVSPGHRRLVGAGT